jgi:hypothetical protein
MKPWRSVCGPTGLVIPLGGHLADDPPGTVSVSHPLPAVRKIGRWQRSTIEGRLSGRCGVPGGGDSFAVGPRGRSAHRARPGRPIAIVKPYHKIRNMKLGSKGSA